MNNPFDSSPPSRRSRDLLNGSLSGLAFLACLDFRLDSVEAIFFHASKNLEFYIDEFGGILLKLYTVKQIWIRRRTLYPGSVSPFPGLAVGGSTTGKKGVHMHQLIKSKTTILPIRNPMNRSPLRRALLLVTLVLGWFALSPTARAVDPPPDGGYLNGNTAEGDNALALLTTGSDNTAIGFNALISNTTGFANTATGVVALSSNTTGTNNTATGVQALNHNNIGSNNTATGF